MENNLFEIKNLYHSYDGKNNVLNNINLKIEKNKIISLFGPSGSGKSTLLYIIGNLLTQSSGKVIYNFENIQKNMGFVFQNFNLINELTIFENCKIAQNIRGYEDINEILELSKNVQISELLNKYPNELSTGQLQRASILRSIVGNTKLILCDEPTGALDSKNKENIMNIFSSLKGKKTIFIVSHDDIVKSYSDKIYYIFDGSIKEA
ncbi:peptide ABC transporter ATP-binding protein [Tepiditoga spiralis]|uniref:Peptide ABC transporter ATP-binding protein n=1 Tax=Tepiditoga spiralis TaxID=2108365 RepID=A0A7G1G658_9BACT|nr:ATP-binding cassette domain-containing protein [Tepiditoga spiralis]BBE31645.1 peptide ABC transporter ATP-binding protein [Tepiditoga spiralis]